MTSSTKTNIQVVTSQQELVEVACEIIVAAAAVSTGQGRFFRIALAGGSTPEPVYTALAGNDGIDWSRWQIFWSDERCVPPTSPESNYQMVKRALLDRLTSPPRVVVRMAGEGDPEAAASAYEEVVREMVPSAPNQGADGLPRFDMVVLGMGNDGHTASLFPHTPALHTTDRLIAPNRAPGPGVPRLTFTYPLLNAARRVLFLVSGASKAITLREVLTGPYQPESYPCQGVRPADGTLTWLVDEEAFSAIEPDL
jgi:6-phosphogluconolactonase